MTLAKFKGWLGVAIVTPGLAAGWAIGGEVLKEELRSPGQDVTHVQRAAGIAGVKADEQLTEFEVLFNERQRGILDASDYAIEKHKILLQPIGP
jgi:hypothetical protein